MSNLSEHEVFDLSSMGYRKLDESRGSWAKPIGYWLCTFVEETGNWSLDMLNASGDVRSVFFGRITRQSAENSCVGYLQNELAALEYQAVATSSTRGDYRTHTQSPMAVATAAEIEALAQRFTVKV